MSAFASATLDVLVNAAASFSATIQQQLGSAIFDLSLDPRSEIVLVLGFSGRSFFGSANLGAALLQQVLSLDIVEGLDHGTVQLLRSPSRSAIFDLSLDPRFRYRPKRI